MQMETAALKKAGDNRNKVFERKVTAVYTPATLEAGALEDVGASEAANPDAAQPVTSSFLLAISEGLSEDDSGGCSVSGCRAVSICTKLFVDQI
jgi:DNA mismatch repair protein MSH3